MQRAIPLVDLHANYLSIRSEIDAAMAEVVAASAFVKGPFVRRFEGAFASALGGVPTRAIGCASGTAALETCLRAVGIRPGDGVLVPSHTFFATAEAIVNVGARPLFVDVEPTDYNVSVATLEPALAPDVRAVVVVHLYGSPCDMAAVRAFTERHGLLLIEDCAQAHFARDGAGVVGCHGHAAAFSFYPGKNLGAFGDAGLALLHDDEAAAFARCYVDHGRDEKHTHRFVGGNLRMDGLQAAVLGAKLPHLEHWIRRRREVAARYDEALSLRGFKAQRPRSGARAVYHLYVVEVGNRDATLAALGDAGIQAGVHYPIPCHRQPAFAALPQRRPLPVTERIVQRVLSLPIYPELSDRAVERVIEVFLDVARP